MIERTDALYDAAVLAHSWHGGQWTALYALGCGQWQHLTVGHIHDALAEYKVCLAHEQASPQEPEYAPELELIIYGLEQWCAEHPLPEEDTND